MDENLEKYRKLHDLVTNQTKAALFGNAGLFGGFKESHIILKLFATYVHALKIENHHIPNTIKSDNFIAYLRQKKSPEAGDIEKVIEKIESLHKRGIIADGPSLQQNTLYNFAIVLDDLGIGLKPELITTQYDRALQNMMTLQSMDALAGKSQKPIVKRGQVAKDKNKPQAIKPENKTAKQPEITRENFSESASAESETPVATEQTQEISTNIDSKKEQTTQSSKKQEEDKTNEQEQKSESLDLHDATFHPVKSVQKKPEEKNLLENPLENPKLEFTEFTGPGEQGEFETGQQAPVIPTTGTAVIGKKTLKRMRNIGGNLRKPVTKTERLREITLQPGEKDKKKSEKASEQEDTTETGQTNTPRTITQGGAAQSIGSSSHLGKKLAKLAGAGVAGGTILPLFGLNSTDAEAADITGKIIKFIIHLFS